MKKSKGYEKPRIVKETKLTFPTDMVKAAKDIACKQCSSCHGCR